MSIEPAFYNDKDVARHPPGYEDKVSSGSMDSRIFLKSIPAISAHAHALCEPRSAAHQNRWTANGGTRLSGSSNSPSVL